MNTTTRVKIGGLYANIAGDGRYASYLAVMYSRTDGVVSIQVSSHGPVGGMDYDSGGRVTERSLDLDVSTNPNAKPADIVKLLKSVLRNNQFLFKTYGKPKKNFEWYGVGKGVSAALVKQALVRANTLE